MPTCFHPLRPFIFVCGIGFIWNGFNMDQYVLYQRNLVGEVDDFRLKFEIRTILSREVIYTVRRKYLFAPSGPRMKLVSSPELKYLLPLIDHGI